MPRPNACIWQLLIDLKANNDGDRFAVERSRVRIATGGPCQLKCMAPLISSTAPEI